MQHWEIFLLFIVIATLYSSVGFGGGSSYLAILALYGWEQNSLRFIALICNLIVVSGSCWVYYKKDLLDLQKALPLVIASIPLSFLGGYMRINQAAFYMILGVTLMVAALLMWKDMTSIRNLNKSNKIVDMGLGSGIGFLSGLVGIGGGIFLSPLLHLTQWGSVRLIAATSAFFIFVNSFAGLMGQALRGIPDLDYRFVFGAGLSVLIGGQIGSRMSSTFFSVKMIKRLTAILVFYVGIRILWIHFSSSF